MDSSEGYRTGLDGSRLRAETRLHRVAVAGPEPSLVEGNALLASTLSLRYANVPAQNRFSLLPKGP
jgi:hypothetical protein